MNKEIRAFVLHIGFFLLFFFMPTQSALFTGAVLSGLELLNEYAREHVLTCLVPAFFIAGAIAVFVRKDVVLKYLGGQAPKYVSYSLASVSGAILAVCSCTILPLFAGIRKRGAGLGPAITFLFSGPAINVAAMFLTLSVLGVNIGLARIISAVLLSILVGLTMQAIFRERTEVGGLFMEEGRQAPCSAKITIVFMLTMVAVLVANGLNFAKINESLNLERFIPDLFVLVEHILGIEIDGAQFFKYLLMLALALTAALIAIKKFPKETNKEWMKETWSFTKMLLPILFIGVFVAGFVMPFLPDELIQKVVGSNSLTGNLAASVFGAFMYFSTLTEIPILQALIAKGMNQGPALALLLAGPSLSLPNMLVVRSVLGTKKTGVYVLLVVFYSTIAGLVFGSF